MAYVQLKAGAHATEDELAEFMRGEIGERAALPRQIRIVDAMPLTAVGKIFKPELKRRETDDALRSALYEAGMTNARVTVESDASRGVSAHVALADPALEAQARAVMGRFPFAFTINTAMQSPVDAQADDGQAERPRNG